MTQLKERNEQLVEDKTMLADKLKNFGYNLKDLKKEREGLKTGRPQIDLKRAEDDKKKQIEDAREKAGTKDKAKKKEAAKAKREEKERLRAKALKKEKELEKEKAKNEEKEKAKAKLRDENEKKRMAKKIENLTKINEELNEKYKKTQEKVESEKEKSMWLNQELLKTNENNEKRIMEREAIKELKGKGNQDVGKLEREIKLKDFLMQKDKDKISFMKKKLNLEMRDEFFGFEPEEEPPADENEEEEIQRMMLKLEKIRKKCALDQERIYEAERGMRTAVMKREKAEKLKEGTERKNVLLQEMIKDYEEFREKADQYDELKAEAVVLREEKNKFDIFKMEAANFVKLSQEKKEAEKFLRERKTEVDQLKIELKDTTASLKEASDIVENFEDAMAVKMADFEVKLEVAVEMRENAEKTITELKKELGKLSTEKVYLEIEKKSFEAEMSKGVQIQESLILANEALKAQLEGRGDTVFEIEKEIQEKMILKNRNEQLEKQLVDLEETGQRRERQLNNVFNKYGDLGGQRDKIEELKAKLEERDKQIMNMMFEINSRAREIDIEDNQMTDMSEELRETKLTLRKLERKMQVKEEAMKEGGGVWMKEDVMEELEEVKREKSMLEKDVLHKDIRNKELEEVIQSLQGKNKDIIGIKEHMTVLSECEQLKAEAERQKERCERIFGEKRLLQELIDHNDEKVNEMHIINGKIRDEMTKYMLENKEMTLGLTKALSKQKDMAVDNEQLKDVIKYKEKLLDVEKDNVLRLEYLIKEWKREVLEARESQRKAEERIPMLEELFVQLENERIDLEENQIYISNNFLERIKSKDSEIQKKIDNVAYKDQQIKRLTDDMAKMKDELDLIRKLMKEKGLPNNTSTMRLGGNKSSMRLAGGRSRMRMIPENNSSRMEKGVSQAIMDDIEMVVKEKEMNRKMKEQIKLLNDRVKELEGSLEGGTKMLNRNAERLEKDLGKLEIERQRLLDVEKEKLMQDKVVAKLEETLKEVGRKQIAGDNQLKKREKEHQEEVEQMSEEVQQMTNRLKVFLNLNAEKLGIQFQNIEGANKIIEKKQKNEEYLTREKLRLEGELTEMTNEKEYLDKELTKSKKEVHKLKDQIFKNENRIQDLLEESDIRGADIHDLEVQVRAANVDIKALEENIATFKEAQSKLTKTKDELIKKVEKELETCIRDKDELKKQRDMFMDENSKLSEQTLKLAEDKKVLEKNIHEVKEVGDEYGDFLEKKRDFLENKLADKMAEIDKLNIKLTNTANPDLNALNQENADYKQRLEKTDMVVDKMLGKVKELKKENDNIKLILKKVKDDPTTGAKEMKILVDDLAHIKMDMDTFTKQKEKERDLLRKQKDSAEDNYQKLHLKNLDLSRNLKVKTNSLIRAEVKLFALAMRVNQLSKNA